MRDSNGDNWENPRSLWRRLALQVLRLILIGVFLYIAYLGFVWRKAPPAPSRAPDPPPAGQVRPPAR